MLVVIRHGLTEIVNCPTEVSGPATVSSTAMAVMARDRAGPRLRAQRLIYPALRPERAPTAILCAAELDIVFRDAADYSAAL